MAVICSCKEGYVLDHHASINSAVAPTKSFQNVFFAISTPFMKDLQAGKIATWLENLDDPSGEDDAGPRKRHKVDEKQEWVNLLGDRGGREKTQEHGGCELENCTRLLVQAARTRGHFQTRLSPGDIRSNNSSARESVNAFYRDFPGRLFRATLSDSNPSSQVVVMRVEGNDYVIPPKTRFHCDDIRNLGALKGEKFDCIVMDPPWWNKYIRRRKAKQVEAGYQMLYDNDLSDMPIEDLAAEGALIVVWCTNSPSHMSAVHEKLFPKWKVTYVSKWYWVKVTKTGIPICPFQPNSGKQPYEQILFGRFTCNIKTCAESPENGKVVVSVPSSIHSHKPPLQDVLKGYLKEDPKCLELFARSLIPGWTSWGNEVLKLQHLSLFQHDLSTESS